MKANDLRVISGLYRGQRLRSPESHLTHPMGAREKLALFNMLQPYFLAAPADQKHEPNLPPLHSAPVPSAPTAPLGPKVLDLYAGSGALGIEALSRGAAEAVFVEKSPRVARLIADNLSALRPAPIKSASKIFSESVANFCQRPEYLSYFDIIIADPPYDNFHPEDLTNISQVLAPNGIFVLSSPAESEPPALPGLDQGTSRTYAAARLTIYRPL